MIMRFTGASLKATGAAACISASDTGSPQSRMCPPGDFKKFYQFPSASFSAVGKVLEDVPVGRGEVTGVSIV